jgi:hypothetical protein
MSKNRFASTIARRLVPTLLICLAFGEIAAAVCCWHRNRELLAAIERNDVQSVVRLLESGADGNTIKRDYWLDLPFGTSFYRGIWPPDAPAPAIFVALDTRLDNANAMQSPHERAALVRALIEHGAKVNVCDAAGATPLTLAVAHNWPNVTRMLLQHRADPNLAREEDLTPLIVSIWGPGNANLTNMLLDAGADIDQQTKGKRETALMTAAWLDKPVFVKLLLDRGANSNIVNVDGQTAVDLARREHASPHVIELLTEKRHGRHDEME